LRLFAIRTHAYLTNYLFCHIPSFALRRFWYTRVLGVRMASGAGIHLNCFIWFYGPGQVRRGGLAIGSHSRINRNCCLDARGGLLIGDNVSVSPEVTILTAQHRVDDPEFRVENRRVVIEDHWIDYENFSATLPEKYFPKGANWLMLGPSGPRRLRLAVEHLAQFRGGICFCIDLDPRWVVKLIKKGWMEHLEAYKQHCIDQALTILSAGHDIKCAFATPKLLQSLCESLEKQGKTFKDTGITGIFCGGTEFTPQWTRFCIEEYFGGPPEQSGIYMTPTYGNTLMGLACSKPVTAEEGYKISYYAPQPRAVAEVVDFDDPLKLVPYGDSGRVKLTTLTKELFIPGFLERDEGEREKPYAKYPWDGVSGVKPWRGIASQTTVGVY
jgi:hypothetical protein